MGGERTPSDTLPNLTRKPASVRAKEGNDMFNWIKYGVGNPPEGEPPADAIPAAVRVKGLPFGYNPPPDEPPSQAAIEQVQREKAAERAAKGLYPIGSLQEWYGPVPLSETEEYKALHAALMGDPPLRDLQIAGFALLNLIKSRGCDE